MRDGTSNCPAVADRTVRDVANSLGEQRTRFLNDAVVFHRRLGRQSPDPEHRILPPDVPQFLQLPDIDQYSGGGKPQIHQSD